ncbi:hypothetical protein CYMTET_38926 [Cymbomonas tetramitiformis]|uniref:Uncharacterized protein n=1 Tax=Cymbomonas tetramitiformis TaxID=36881 RepID=A0AAE0CB30_9CHLO|nr:hypothetical protein CYMTET_38926 [Cymbomonas tetramitiformis]
MVQKACRFLRVVFKNVKKQPIMTTRLSYLQVRARDADIAELEQELLKIREMKLRLHGSSHGEKGSMQGDDAVHDKVAEAQDQVRLRDVEIERLIKQLAVQGGPQKGSGGPAEGELVRKMQALEAEVQAREAEIERLVQQLAMQGSGNAESGLPGKVLAEMEEKVRVRDAEIERLIVQLGTKGSVPHEPPPLGSEIGVPEAEQLLRGMLQETEEKVRARDKEIERLIKQLVGRDDTLHAADNADWSGKLAETEAMVRTREAEIEELVYKQGMLEEVVRTKDLEIGSLQRDLEEYRQTRDPPAPASSSQREQEARVRQLKHQLAEMEDSADAEAVRVKKLKEELEEMEDKVRARDVEIERLVKQAAAGTLLAVHPQENSSNPKDSHREAQLVSQVAEMRVKLKEKAKELEEAQAKLREAEEDPGTPRTRIGFGLSALEKQLKAAKKDNERLRAELDQVSMRSELEHVSKRVQHLEAGAPPEGDALGGEKAVEQERTETPKSGAIEEQLSNISQDLSHLRVELQQTQATPSAKSPKEGRTGTPTTPAEKFSELLYVCADVMASPPPQFTPPPPPPPSSPKAPGGSERLTPFYMTLEEEEKQPETPPTTFVDKLHLFGQKSASEKPKVAPVPSPELEPISDARIAGLDKSLVDPDKNPQGSAAESSEEDATPRRRRKTERSAFSSKSLTGTDDSLKKFRRQRWRSRITGGRY